MRYLCIIVAVLVLLGCSTAFTEIVRPDAHNYIGKWSEIRSAKLCWTGMLAAGDREWQEALTGEIIHTRIDVCWHLGVAWSYEDYDWDAWSSYNGPITGGEVDLTAYSSYLARGWAQWYEYAHADFEQPPYPGINWVRIIREDEYLHSPSQILYDRWLEIDGTRAHVIPEPSSILGLLVGLGGVGILVRRKHF